MIKSANLHVVGGCNYRCNHCFDRCLTKKFLSPEQWIPHLDYLKEKKVEKINIAGGEPMLYPHLEELLCLLKSMGFKTSIVSNGSKITEEWIARNHKNLDWLGLSIDSPDEEDEIAIGRHIDGLDHISNIKHVAQLAHKYGVKVKLNITAVRKSITKDFGAIIEEVKAERVKVFRALTLIGANDDIPDTWSVTDEEFKAFVERHKKYKNIVFEDNDDMVASYLMFDPLGNWMIDKGGVKRFLPFEQLVAEGMETNVDASRYIKRQGIYDW